MNNKKWFEPNIQFVHIHGSTLNQYTQNGLFDQYVINQKKLKLLLMVKKYQLIVNYSIKLKMIIALNLNFKDYL